MCHYYLAVCPYPHHDPVRILVFDPLKLEAWRSCDLPRPWGRLSCGELSIHHPVVRAENVSDVKEEPDIIAVSGLAAALYRNSLFSYPVMRNVCKKTIFHSELIKLSRNTHSEEPALPTEKCLWCSTVLKGSASMSKMVQEETRQKLATMQKAIEENHSITMADRQIETNEKSTAYQKQLVFQERNALFNGSAVAFEGNNPTGIDDTTRGKQSPARKNTAKDTSSELDVNGTKPKIGTLQL